MQNLVKIILLALVEVISEKAIKPLIEYIKLKNKNSKRKKQNKKKTDAYKNAKGKKDSIDSASKLP